jgi:hypothetical protein
LAFSYKQAAAATYSTHGIITQLSFIPKTHIVHGESVAANGRVCIIISADFIINDANLFRADRAKHWKSLRFVGQSFFSPPLHSFVPLLFHISLRPLHLAAIIVRSSLVNGLASSAVNDHHHMIRHTSFLFEFELYCLDIHLRRARGARRSDWEIMDLRQRISSFSLLLLFSLSLFWVALLNSLDVTLPSPLLLHKKRNTLSLV